jgi:hypothetical protein
MGSKIFFSLFSNLAFFVCLVLFHGSIQLETNDENGVHQQRSSHPTATISSPMSVVLQLFVVATNVNDVQAMLALRTAFNNKTNWMSSKDPCNGIFFFFFLGLFFFDQLFHRCGNSYPFQRFCILFSLLISLFHHLQVGAEFLVQMATLLTCRFKKKEENI